MNKDLMYIMVMLIPIVFCVCVFGLLFLRKRRERKKLERLYAELGKLCYEHKETLLRLCCTTHDPSAEFIDNELFKEDNA